VDTSTHNGKIVSHLVGHHEQANALRQSRSHELVSSESMHDYMSYNVLTSGNLTCVLCIVCQSYNVLILVAICCSEKRLDIVDIVDTTCEFHQDRIGKCLSLHTTQLSTLAEVVDANLSGSRILPRI
jgi:hypothetical protein